MISYNEITMRNVTTMILVVLKYICTYLTYRKIKFVNGNLNLKQREDEYA